MNTEQLRHLLPITRNINYMNTGWAGPSPIPVIQRVSETMEWEALNGPASRKGLEFIRGVFELGRQSVSDLLNCDSGEAWVTHSTTEGVNIVIHGLDWDAGDELVVCDLEHVALMSPAQVLAQRKGVNVNVAAVSPKATRDDILEIIDRELRPGVKLVALSHIQYTCGLKMPIKEITDLAHQKGIPVLVDGAQSVGQIEVNVKDLGCDFYAMSGQKWLMGPTGTGALYVSKSSMGLLEPHFTTNDLESVRPTERLPLARFSLASQSGALVAGLIEAVSIANQIGLGQIETRSLALSDLLRERVSHVAGCEVLGPITGPSSCGLVTLRVGDWDPSDLVEELEQQFGIAARAVHNPDGIRFSTHFFNTEDEVERVAATLVEVASRHF